MILITAPNSTIGRQVIDVVLESGEPIRVIARDPSRLPESTRNRVEVIQGSHSDADVVNKAFAGADSVFWLVPADPRAANADAAYVDFARPALDAFTQLGVKRVVGISALGRGTPMARNAGHVTATLKMDDLIAETGVAYRALINASFMDNTLRQAQRIKTQHMFASPITADLMAPACATRDIADAAAALLLDTSWTGVGSQAILGPADLSFNEMAQTMSEVLGEPIAYRQIPLDVFGTQLTERGMSPGMVRSTVDMIAAKNNGLDNAEPRTPQSTTPTSFRQWCDKILKPALLQ